MIRFVLCVIICGSYTLAMDKRIARNPDKGLNDLYKKSPYFYKSTKSCISVPQVTAKESSLSPFVKPFASLIYDRENNLIIATAMLLSNCSQSIIVTVKKRTDIDWTDVYSIEHNVKRNIDYAFMFLLERHLKEKIKVFEGTL